MIGSSSAPKVALVATLVLLIPQVAFGQPAAPPTPEAPPPAEEGTGAAETPAGTAEPGAKPGESPAEGAGGAGGDAEPDSAAPPAEATAATSAATEGDDEDDDWGMEEKPPPPMVMPDFDQPQLEGIHREPHHDHRWMYHNLTAVRVNPLGLVNRFRTGYRMQLSHRPEPAFYDSFASLQLDTEITPAYGIVGGRVEVQPIALVNIWASYGLVGTFNSFGNTHSLASAQEEYDDDTMGDTKDQDYSTTGQKAMLSGLFQVAIGGVAVRNNVKATWMNMDLRDNHQVFWDATLDVMVPDSGWVITNDADLLFLTDFDLKLGIRHTLTHAIYRSEHRADQPNINTPTHRIGPAFLYTFFEDDIGSMWNKPTVLVLAQWWAQHRYRTTQSPALPYLVIGFIQQGDFFTSPKQ
ncbi:MAG: hypothetical protein JRI68_14150 [Deltaproteobacteria bacterium]|nr:hypothetical protein [Deltaproteobacteria bacterium]